ncbi:MAG: sigma-70 family RNA polymerase sigma factor [Propionibacteriaceae bacterium]|nr:sigma-70 family RNA polymerase sigma factor [Propionibacteriaceae bacterium]
MLTQVGVGVEIAADPLHGLTFQDRTPPRLRQPTPTGVGHSPTQQTPPQDPAAGVVSVWRGGVESDPEMENTHATHVAAARMMQAGVVAQAALDGRPEAVRAAAGVPRQRLEELVERGRLGKAQLIAFTRPMVVAALREDLARRRGPAGDDLLSAAQTHVAEQITTWDETRGRLAGWVWQVARQEAGRWVTRGRTSEQALKRHETLSESVEDHAHTAALDSPTLGVEEQVMQAWSVQELRQRITQLDPTVRDVVTARFGLATGEVETRASIGNRLGLSVTTVQRIEARAVQELRQVQRTEIDQSLPGLSARLRDAVPRELVARLGREQKQRAAVNEPRPLIDRIKERAEAARNESQLSRWMTAQQPDRNRDREEGPER